MREKELCENCDGTGHLSGCPAMETAWDIGDLMCAETCDGCCPCGAPERLIGIQKIQRDAQQKTKGLFRNLVK